MASNLALLRRSLCASSWLADRIALFGTGLSVFVFYFLGLAHRQSHTHNTLASLEQQQPDSSNNYYHTSTPTERDNHSNQPLQQQKHLTQVSALNAPHVILFLEVTM